jgi:hypothetical protein
MDTPTLNIIERGHFTATIDFLAGTTAASASGPSEVAHTNINDGVVNEVLPAARESQPRRNVHQRP